MFQAGAGVLLCYLLFYSTENPPAPPALFIVSHINICISSSTASVNRIFDCSLICCIGENGQTVNIEEGLSLRKSTSFIRRFYWQTEGKIVFLTYRRQLTSRNTSFRSYCPPVELLIYELPNGKSPGQEGRVTGCSYGDEQAGWGGQEKETSCFKLTDAAQKKMEREFRGWKWTPSSSSSSSSAAAAAWPGDETNTYEYCLRCF